MARATSGGISFPRARNASNRHRRSGKPPASTACRATRTNSFRYRTVASALPGRFAQAEAAAVPDAGKTTHHFLTVETLKCQRQHPARRHHRPQAAARATERGVRVTRNRVHTNEAFWLPKVPTKAKSPNFGKTTASWRLRIKPQSLYQPQPACPRPLHFSAALDSGSGGPGERHVRPDGFPKPRPKRR